MKNVNVGGQIKDYLMFLELISYYKIQESLHHLKTPYLIDLEK